MADLHSKILDTRPPPPRGSKFFQFHAVLGEIWQNRMLAPPWRVGALLGEILDPPLVCASGHGLHIIRADREPEKEQIY